MAQFSIQKNICHLILVILVGGLLTACQEEKVVPKPEIPTVLYQTVTPGVVTFRREVPGRIAPLRMAEVRPQVGGILQKRLFEEGMTVQQGQILYQIDPAPYRTARDTAYANLEKALSKKEAAKRYMERCILLAQKNAVRQQERDNAIAAYKQVQAEIKACEELLATAQINLDYTNVKAPVGGKIGRSYVTEGTLLTSNQDQVLAVIRQLDPIYIDVTQSSAELLTLRQALASGSMEEAASKDVQLTLENGTPYVNPKTGQPIRGELLFSEIAVDPETGTVTIRVRFQNDYGLLLPGMYVRALLVEGQLKEAITIPQRSVIRDLRNRTQVYVLEPSDTPDIFLAQARLVTIERDYQGRWLVRSGLSRGERLVVEGMFKIRPGQKVRATVFAEERKTRPKDH